MNKYTIDTEWLDEGGYCQVYPIKNHKELVFKEFYNKKSSLVKESITTWLEENYKKLNLKELSNEFIRSQNDKVFILWDKDTFYIDIFDKDELTVSNIIGIKNFNYIAAIIFTKCKNQPPNL